MIVIEATVPGNHSVTILAQCQRCALPAITETLSAVSDRAEAGAIHVTSVVSR